MTTVILKENWAAKYEELGISKDYEDDIEHAG